MALTKSGKIAGGKKGRSGRKAGGYNTRSREIAAKAAEGGLTPLEYMLQVMRDENECNERRDQMAFAAAPYIHPKLNAISAPSGGPVELSLQVSFVGAAGS